MGAAFGLFGDTTTSLVANGFFTWFQLEPSTEPTEPGERVYRPKGPTFHALVSLVAEVDPHGRLQRLTLKVARAFIDNPRQSAFARDIVKSFLDGVAGDDQARVAPLVQDIFLRDLGAPVLMRGPTPMLSGEPAPGYAVFRGQADAWSTPLSRVTLALTNIDGPDGPRLVASAAALPPSTKGLFDRARDLWNSIRGE
jgi:hypothetical protein